VSALVFFLWGEGGGGIGYPNFRSKTFFLINRVIILELEYQIEYGGGGILNEIYTPRATFVFIIFFTFFRIRTEP